MSKLAAVKGKLSVRLQFDCSSCGRAEIGGNQTIEINTLSVDNVSDQLRSIRPVSAHMPVGWSYDGTFKCPKCNGYGKGLHW